MAKLTLRSSEDIINRLITDFNKRFDYFANHLSKDRWFLLLLLDSRSNYTLSQTTVNAECTMIPSHLATDRRELFMRTRALDYDKAGYSTEVIADAVGFFSFFIINYLFDIQLFTVLAWCQSGCFRRAMN